MPYIPFCSKGRLDIVYSGQSSTLYHTHIEFLHNVLSQISIKYAWGTINLLITSASLDIILKIEHYVFFFFGGGGEGGRIYLGYVHTWKYTMFFK